MAALLKFGRVFTAGVLREGPKRLDRFLPYWRAELAPPKVDEWPVIKAGFEKLFQGFQKQNWRKMTVKQTALHTLVAVEIMCWFFVGEMIGRWNMIGYVIPWTAHKKDD